MPAQMAEAYVRLAIAPEFEAVTGQYFDEHCRVVKPYRAAYDRAVRERLWTISTELTHV